MRIVLAFLVLIFSLPALAQTPIDVFLIGGQSNAVGNGDSAQSPICANVFQVNGSAVSAGVDPVGAANTGSAWPAFGCQYAALTGRLIAFIPAASNGSAQLEAVGDYFGTLNWDDNGTLVTAALTAVTDALTALEAAGYAPTVMGVLWLQGEEEAIYMAQTGLNIVTDYDSALARMIARFQDAYPVPFFILRIGHPVGSSSWMEPDFQLIRNAQENRAANDTHTRLSCWIASEFGPGMMKDDFHYTQDGYNAIGAEAAGAVVGYLNIGSL